MQSISASARGLWELLPGAGVGLTASRQHERKITTTTRLSTRTRGTICPDRCEAKPAAATLSRKSALIGSARFFYFCCLVVDASILRGAYFKVIVIGASGDGSIYVGESPSSSFPLGPYLSSGACSKSQNGFSPRGVPLLLLFS